jgi:hypothetical protein
VSSWLDTFWDAQCPRVLRSVQGWGGVDGGEGGDFLEEGGEREVEMMGTA